MMRPCALEFIEQLPVIDEGVEADLNAIAMAVKAWRASPPRRAGRKRQRNRGTLH